MIVSKCLFFFKFEKKRTDIKLLNEFTLAVSLINWTLLSKIKETVRYVFIVLFLLAPSLVLAQDPTGFAILRGTETTSPGDSTDLNQGTAYALKWSDSSVDPTYFTHSTSSFSHELTINSFGDYLVTLTVPLQLIDNLSRPVVVSEVYVNGTPVAHGRSASSYIRNASNHLQSSLHTAILLEGLGSNDKVSIFVSGISSLGRITTVGAQMSVEYIDPSRNIFTASATRTTSSTNVNQGTFFDLEWAESIKDSGFTHSDVSNAQNITLSAGDYYVHFNIPLLNNTTCANRNAPQVRVQLGGGTVTGGVASQGYYRCEDGSNMSSLHWSGVLRGVGGGQNLTFSIGAESGTESTIVPAGREASVFLEQISATTDHIVLSGNRLLSGTNWNPSGSSSEVQWSTQSAIDGSVFSHSTSTNNHVITLLQDGDYFVSYNDHLTSTAARANPRVQILVNNAVYETAICTSHYIRNGSGQTESSCSLNYYLQGLSTGDTIEVELLATSVTGTVNDASDAVLTAKRVGPASGDVTCTNIVDCTPNLILHYDGSQLPSVLDSSNRGADDLSFTGSVQTWLDISGSTTDHDGTQTTGGSQPTFDPVTNGLQFDGNDSFNIDNHPDLNEGTLKSKSIVVAFKTGADVTNPQVIYEEGGTVRGMNVYVRAGSLYIAFWNLANDGDGAQAFTSASTSVQPNTNYYASLVIDYDNYSGAAGPDGELRGHINGVAFASLGTTTSRLFPHGGAIALGAMRNDTYFDTGPQSGNGFFFTGDIYEFMIYNHPVSNTDATDFYTYLTDKWPDPQPVTNLNLTSNYTNLSTQTPNINWTASVTPDVSFYEIALGTTAGASDVQGFTSVGNVVTANLTGLSLSECVDYYATVRAVDVDSNPSTEETTDFIRYDGTNPTDPSSLVLSGSASTTNSETLSWTTSSDACSLSHYEVALGTSTGASDVVTWIDVGNVTSYSFTGLSLANATDYFMTVRAVDSAGNTSGEISSVAWQVATCVASDVTDPTDPGAVSTSGTALSTASPQHNWTPSTDACGFSHYEFAIGTSAGADDVFARVNIGDVLTYRALGLSGLSTNTNYFSSVRAVDLAGNTSNDISSAAWQLPTPGNVSSGLVLWLDSDDAATIFSDTGCLTNSNDGDRVRCWLDKSTAANNMSTTANNTSPLYETNEFNTKPIVRLDGGNDALDFTSAITTIRTVFIVNKSGETNWQSLLGHTTARDFYSNGNTLVASTIASTNVINGAWRVDLVDVGSPVSFAQTGSYSLISLVTTGNVSADHIASDQKTGGRYYGGDVAEVIIYDRALTNGEITDVETYLYNKWFTAVPAAVTGLNFDTSYTTVAATSPSFSWTHTTAPDLDHYEVALGTSPGSNDIAGWINMGTSNSYQFNGLSLTECIPFYASVRAVDTDGFVSSTSSTQLANYDMTPPIDPNGFVISGTATETTSIDGSWNASSDTCSASISYEVALGTSSSSDDVIAWTDIGNVTNYKFNGIAPNLLFATDYFYSVRAVDEAGNTSGTLSSAAWQLDTCVSSDVTDPTDPSSLNQAGTATVTSSPNFDWTASTDACSLSHYEVSLGTSAGSDNVNTWTNIGLTTTHSYANLSPNLSYSTNYFFNVRAVDSAGNTSSAVSTSSWQLTSPGNVSATGLNLWLDLDDAQRIFSDASCSASESTNGARVGCVKDKSGNDNHATNSVGSNQPIFSTGSFNAKNALYFDGSRDEFLDFGVQTDIRTVFWVLKEDSSNPGTTAFLLGDPGGSTFDFHRGGTTSGPIFDGASASANVLGGTLQLNGVSADGTTTTMPTSEAVLSLVTSGNTRASSFSRDRTSCCGSRTWGGNLAELIIFNRALNPTEVSDVESYLTLKWGLTSGSTEWTGAVNNDWFNASNWSDGVPTLSTNCVINDRANDPILVGGPATCNDVSIGNGVLTFSNGTSANLEVYGDFLNTGTLTPNDGQITMRDDGISNSDQIIQSSSNLFALSFNKTAGGKVTLNSSIQISSLTLPTGSNFEMVIPNGITMSLPSGMTQQAGTMNVQGGGAISVGSGQQINVSGGSFTTTGTIDAFPQATSNKATLQSISGRWSFVATGGSVSLAGFLIDNIDRDGLQINGTADLAQLDGGQFINLDADYVTPVKAIQLNTTTNITETTASSVGFHWAGANANYSSNPTPTDDYFLVYAPDCGNSVLVFDQWFGDFWGTNPQPDLESKILDDADGPNTCQISIDISASPVNLITLSATAYQESVQLRWETGAEVDHLGFNVYRSDSPNGTYTQINIGIIRNFATSTTFKGNYSFTDTNLMNGQTYYYMIEDVSLGSVRTLHGPVEAMPLGVLDPVSSAPVVTPDNTVDEPVSAGPVDLGGGVQIVDQTQGALRLRVQPGALTVSSADWNSSYSHIYLPGYSQWTTAGSPELLSRRFLIEVDEPFSSSQTNQVSIQLTDQSAALSGNEITPSPDWVLNTGNQLLEPNYSVDSSVYSQNQLLPSVTYTVASESLMINGKPFLEVVVQPAQYNPVTRQLNVLSDLIIDIGLDSSPWETTAPSASYSVNPAAIANTVRVRYEEEGMYSMSFGDLESANADGPLAGSNVADLRAYYHSKEIAIEMISADSIFNSGDEIRFYGDYEASLHDRFDEIVLTTENLRAEEDVPQINEDPKRIVDTNNDYSPSPILADSEYRRQQVQEQNLNPIFDVPMGGNIDHIYWKRLFTVGGSAADANSWLDTSFDLVDLNTSSSENIRIEVEVRGRGVFAANPVHELALYLNGSGTATGAQQFQNDEPVTLAFEIPAYSLSAGLTQMRFESTASQVDSGDYDLMDINKVTVSYPSLFEAVDDTLMIQSVENQQIYVEGFTTDQLLIYDLSHPENSMKYQLFVSEPLGGGFYSASFDAYPGVHGFGGEKILITTVAELKTPAQFQLSYGHDFFLKEDGLGADFLVIGQRDLLSAASDLIQRRQAQGLQTVAIDIEQIYAEFSHGRKDPKSLQDFLAHTLAHWSPRPQYLLLLGDATYDPRGQVSALNDRLIPMPIEKGISTDYGSDNYYVRGEETVVPQMAVGRLPSSDPDEIYAYVQKVIDYEQGSKAPTAEQASVSHFVSGEDTLNENYDGQIAQLSQALKQENTLLSSKTLSQNDYASVGDAHTALVDQFNEGSLATFYFGHGAENLWSDYNFFNEEDAIALNNSSLPVVVALNCLNAHYYDADTTSRSLGENLIFNSEGGAVLFWGSTTLTAPVVQLNLATNFINQLSAETAKAYQVSRYGDMMLQSLASLGDDSVNRDTLESWTLFGDPTLTLPETAFKGVAEAAPRAPASGGSGGGGCSAFASHGPTSAPAWWWLELLFFLAPITINRLRKRKRGQATSS